MARGNRIVATADPKGKWDSGIINDTSKPGTIMMIDSSVSVQNGRLGWKAANNALGQDGRQQLHTILVEDWNQGFSDETAYVKSTLAQLYHFLPGDELNVRVGEIAGTGNSYTIGDQLILDAEDGLLVPYAGSPQQTFAIAMETKTGLTGLTGGSLLLCKMM